MNFRSAIMAIAFTARSSRMLITPISRSPIYFIMTLILMFIGVNNSYGIGDNSETITVAAVGNSLEMGVLSGGSIRDKDIVRPNIFEKFLLGLVEWESRNWATGTRDYSVTSRIRDLGFTVDEYNAARSGATVKDAVLLQIEDIEKWNNGRINLLLIFIGGNDILARTNAEMTSVDEFRLYYEMLAEYARYKAIAPVFVMLPDFTRLYGATLDKKNVFGMDCRYVQNKITKSALNITTAENLRVTRERILAYNEVIRDVSDGVLVETMAMRGVDSSEVSGYDCTHANKKGQKKIADLVWDAIDDPL